MLIERKQAFILNLIFKIGPIIHSLFYKNPVKKVAKKSHDFAHIFLHDKALLRIIIPLSGPLLQA